MTNELYPLGPGGIGRMLYNFARHNATLGGPADIHFLVPAELVADEASEALLDAHLGDLAKIHVAPALGAIPSAFVQLLSRADPWTLDSQVAHSYRYYLGLLAAESSLGKPFDVIEFPDFGGWALASVEAKRAGLAFADTLICARIHSSQGILYKVERFAHYPSTWLGVLFDAERHLLRHADRVIGHDAAVLDFNESHYGIADQWQGRTVLEFPPVLLDAERSSTTYLAQQRLLDEERAMRGASPSTDFVFSSRLQQFKRPDLFVRAAIAFIERNPDYQGIFRIVSYGWDDQYINGLKSLVPEGMRSRIHFVLDATPIQREIWVRDSVVVVPSDYESLCLFAFEAGQMGCKIILNRQCPAFGASPRWRDGDNCLLFDGTVEDLVDVMARSIDWSPQSTVESEPDEPYWLKGDLHRPSQGRSLERSPSVSVVCFDIKDSQEFRRHFSVVTHIESSLRLGSGEDEVVFLLPKDAFSTEGDEAKALERRGWKCVFTSGHSESPDTLTQRLRSRPSDLIFLYPYGYEVHPDFLRVAHAAMEGDSSIALFGGHVEQVDSESGRTDRLLAYGGEMPSLALTTSRVTPVTSMIRRNLLDRQSFDARAGDLWFEAFARFCAIQGESMVIAPMIAATRSTLAPVDNTKALTAGILDATGHAAGLTARLLAVNLEWDSAQEPRFVYENEQLQPAIRLHPKGSPREWEPVAYRADLGGLLVHPLDEGVTIAGLNGPARRISRVVAIVENTKRDNAGIEASVALLPAGVSENHVATQIEKGEEPVGYSLGAWRLVDPGATLEISVSTMGTSRGNDRVLLMTRLPMNGDERNCHAVFRRVEAWFGQSSV